MNKFCLKNFKIVVISNPNVIINPFSAYGAKTSNAKYFGSNGLLKLNLVEL